jgi:putative DNA primase/helicase
LGAYLGKTDSHKSTDVRALLTPLIEFAARLNVAVVVVMHPNKSQGQSAMNRVNGSLDFVAAARTGYMVAKDPNNPDRRYFLPIKNNIGSDRIGYAFGINVVELSEGIKASQVVWEPEPVTVSADEILNSQPNYGGRRELESAKRWLAEYLADGPKPTKEVEHDADGNGHSWATIRLAKQALGVAAVRKGGVAAKGQWVWMMPDAKMLNQESS